MKLNGKAAIYYWPRKLKVIKHYDQFKYCLGHLLNQVKSIIMTQPITAEVRERVVQQHIAGLGRNIISKRTGLSRGSNTNILKGWGTAIRTFVHNQLLVQKKLFQTPPILIWVYLFQSKRT
jgi:hypothetical protein